MEELGAPQPQLERVLHQASQGAGEARQGPLLDHRPLDGVHVRGGKLPPTAARLPPQVPGAEAPVPPILLRERAGAGGRLREPGARRRGVRERVSKPVPELPGIRDVRAGWRGVLRLAVPRGSVQSGATHRRGDLQDDGGDVQDRRVVGVQERGDSGVQERARLRGQEPGAADLQAGGRIRGEGPAAPPGTSLQGERGYHVLQVPVQPRADHSGAWPRLLRRLRAGRGQQQRERWHAGHPGTNGEQQSRGEREFAPQRMPDTCNG